MRNFKKYLVVLVVGGGLALLVALPIFAQPSTLLGTVNLPSNGCSVAGTFDGTYFMTTQTNCASSTLLIYQPPVGGSGNATLVATKSVVDGGGNPVIISALAWDPNRNAVWGAEEFGFRVSLITIGDPTVSGPATATFQFTANVEGAQHIDGLAYDQSDDTLYYSPDVNLNVYQFSLGTAFNPANPPLGTLMNTVTPKNALGQADGSVSGVAIGSANTLYIGRDGAAEIRRIDKTTGAFISQFATTSGRVEDLTCDPVTYAPKEAILAKDAFQGIYEAFEVEPGTCPLPVLAVEIDIKPGSDPNCINADDKGIIPVAILTTDTFDAATVDPFSVTLEGAGVRVKGKSGNAGSLEDVDGDGDLDLVVQIVDDSVLTGKDTAILNGNLLQEFGGTPIKGTDSICIVP